MQIWPGGIMVDSTDILLFAAGTEPKIVARCTYKAETDTFAVDSLKLGEGTPAPEIKLAGSKVAIPEALLLDDHSALKPVGQITTDALKSAYAALCTRLADLEIDRQAGFFGLPATARYSVKASIVLPPVAQPANAPEIGFRALCHLEIAAPGASLRGHFDFEVVYSEQMPKLSGTFGWPSFGFNFADLDFPNFALIDRPFALPDLGGWLPKTRIVWTAPAPKLTLTLDRGLSLTIDAEGAPATGTVELDGTEILKIAAFKVEGPVDNPRVTLDLTASGSADVPPGDIEIGPLTVAWDNVRSLGERRC